MKTPSRLPGALSARSSATAAALLSKGGREIDVAIGGLPFRLATTTDIPSAIETIPARKEQFDTEQEPGEQSLSGWWRRSQDSWHGGAGSLYQESRLTDVGSTDFFDSMGVEVFVKNKITLLREMQLMDGAGGFGRLTPYSTASVSAVANGKLYTAASKASTFSELHAPASKTIVDGFVSGTSFYDVASDGSLYQGTVASPGTATTWPLGAAASRLAFGKNRLWVIGGQKIWQPDLTDAGGTAQPPIFTHPNAGWSYTCIAEGPSAMYFGGHDGRSSSIHAVELADDGAVPTLSGARVTAVLPDGELVQEIAVLAGRFMGIGTSKGFRVGQFDGNVLTYGPLLIEPEGATGCSASATAGRFFLVAFTTTAGPAVTYKVDTGAQIGDGIFPYAKNVYVGNATDPGVITSLCVVGEDVLACDSTGNVYAQATGTLVASGYLKTGRVRFRTTDRKIFRYLEIETQPLQGAIQMFGFTETGSQFDIATFNLPGEVSSGAYAINSMLGPQRQVALKFTLARDPSDSTLGPELNSYLLRAVPAVRPQRLYTLPLLCFDFEQGVSGQRYGHDSFAEDRLHALQELEDLGDVLTFQDFRKRQVTGEQVVIDSLRFVQTSAARLSPPPDASSWWPSPPPPAPP